MYLDFQRFTDIFKFMLFCSIIIYKCALLSKHFFFFFFLFFQPYNDAFFDDLLKLMVLDNFCVCDWLVYFEPIT